MQFVMKNWLKLRKCTKSISRLLVLNLLIQSFSTYVTSGWGGKDKSPFSLEELKSLTPKEIVKKAYDFKPEGTFKSPTREGLGGVLKDLLISSFEKLKDSFSDFTGLGNEEFYYFVEGMIKGYEEQEKIEWNKFINDVSPKLLNSGQWQVDEKKKGMGLD